MIDPHHPYLSIAAQCRLIELPRSSYYRYTHAGMESDDNLYYMRLIDEIYTARPYYGSRKITKQLKAEGYPVNRKRIQRLMNKMGIASIAPKPGTSQRCKQHDVYPYLLNNLAITRPNQVWCSDITYIRMKQGFVYLVAVMDWYSRKVLSWEVSNTMDDGFCVEALNRAIRLYGCPEIFNTDQGAQFTGYNFINALKGNDIQISMDGKGRWVDNVFIERLWRTVKYEDIYIKDYETVCQLKLGLRTYLDDYNQARIHQALDYLTPDHVYHESKEAA